MSTAAPDSYYGRPILKAPVWTWEVPAYFFTGGLAGASAGLAFAAERAGHEVLARRTWPVALGALSASPALLVSDLGRPERFLYMLRLVKPTSPMSVGSWVLTVGGLATAAATLIDRTGRLPRFGPVAGGAAALFGLPLTTYTAVLVANTAVPAWHEARRILPFAFAASAAASAGGAAAIVTPAGDAAPARRLGVAAGVAELAATEAMVRGLGSLGAPYREGPAARLAWASRASTAGGAALLGLAGRRRAAAAAGGALLLAGSLALRFSVMAAGRQSAADPAAVVEPQRARTGAP